MDVYNNVAYDFALYYDVFPSHDLVSMGLSPNLVSGAFQPQRIFCLRNLDVYKDDT